MTVDILQMLEQSTAPRPAYNNAAVLHGPLDIRQERRKTVEPAEGQVEVQIIATGLCGSDLHYRTHGKNGDFKLIDPLVLGHEAAGIITAVGPGVGKFKIGDAVAIEAGIRCKECSYCQSGRYNLCPNLRFASSAKTHPHLDGTLQDYMIHPAHAIHRLPIGCSFELGALAEPLSVLIHASRRASLSPGNTVLVFGIGTIGLLACAYAKACGASRVVAIDVNKGRVEFAKAAGFADDALCLPARGEMVKTLDEQMSQTGDVVKKLLNQIGVPEGFDLVYECSGHESCIQMGVHAATSGGKLVLVGMGSRYVHLPLLSAATREVDIIGSFRYANTYPEALALLGSGKLPNVGRLVTHRFTLEHTARAFELLARGKDEDGNVVIKVVIGPNYP